jgi:outer membrane biosynthesis protein TonB
VVTKNVSGTYVNSYDTSLDMSPRNGIVLNGTSINLQAGYRLNIGDGMGATVAATMGNLNINGREISIDSYNSTEYLFHTIYQGLEYLVNAASGGMALGKADIKIADYVKYSEDSLESLVKIARKIFSLNAKRKAIRKERLKEDPPQVVLPPEDPPLEEQLSLEPLPEPQLPDLPQVEPPPQEDLQVVLAPEPPPQEKSQVEPVEKTENPPKVDTAQVQDASRPTAEQSYGQVKSLMSAQDKTRAAAMYQKGGGGTNPGPHLTSESTFGNQAAFDVAEATGFNTSALYGGASRLDVNATTAAKNLANAAGSIVSKVDGKGAQALANSGYTVIAAWPNDSGPGHLATVRPSSKPYNDAEGPEVSNVSTTNSIKPAVEAFYGNPVSYYYDPNQQFKYDASVIAKRR